MSGEITIYKDEAELIAATANPEAESKSMAYFKHREAAQNYARAIGWSEADVLAASDERLDRLMSYMADECAKYGCD